MARQRRSLPLSVVRVEATYTTARDGRDGAFCNEGGDEPSGGTARMSREPGDAPP
jgi:hypothetical protein